MGWYARKTECVQELSGVNAMLLPMHHRICAVIHAVLCGRAIVLYECIFVIDEFIECIHIFIQRCKNCTFNDVCRSCSILNNRWQSAIHFFNQICHSRAIAAHVMRNKNGVFTNKGIHMLCALPHTLQVISKCLLPCGISLCMRPTLSQQPLHAHVGVQLEYTHMLPYAGTIQSYSDDISPGAVGNNRQNLLKIVAKHHNQAAKG